MNVEANAPSPRTGGLRGRASLGASIGVRSPTRQEVIAYGGIADPAETGLRSSARLRAQPNGDASTMERATSLADRRDSMLDAGTGTKRKLSFVNLPNAVIISRASCHARDFPPS